MGIGYFETRPREKKHKFPNFVCLEIHKVSVPFNMSMNIPIAYLLLPPPLLLRHHFALTSNVSVSDSLLFASQSSTVGALAACDRGTEAHSHRPNNSAVVDLCNLNDLTPSRYRFGIIRRRYDVEHPIESNTPSGNKISNAHQKRCR